jgi:hypothetical protein
MGIVKVAERLNRETFWMYAVPLVVGHAIVSLIVTVSWFGGLGGLDIVILWWLARVVGSRFRDIGWPAWAGISFVIVTMMALPLIAVAVAAAVEPRRTLEVLNVTGLVVAPLNLLLIVVAGSVPGTATTSLARLAAAFDEPEKQEEPAAVIAPPITVMAATRPLLVGGACVAIAVLVAVFVHSLFSAPTSPAVSLPSPPRAGSYATVRPGDQPAAGTGLTKETNDFLRQFSAQSRQGGAGTRPAAGNSIWPDPSKVLSQQKAAP